MHVGAAQLPLKQTALAQSFVPLHSLPAGHGMHMPPPQSTSVSPLFFLLSPQPGAIARSPERALRSPARCPPSSSSCADRSLPAGPIYPPPPKPPPPDPEQAPSPT